MIDTTLNDAFGQRQVSTIYSALNQYHVVMEAAPEYWQSPDALDHVYVSTSNGSQVPLSAFAHYAPTNTSLGVNHQSQFVASTISFNLPEGTSLGQATVAIDDCARAGSAFRQPYAAASKARRGHSRIRSAASPG